MVLLRRMMREDPATYGVPYMGDLTPPASKQEVTRLMSLKVEVGHNKQCPVCLDVMGEKLLIKMPCDHVFHQSCLLPWLQKTNTCPSCRHELPTDNEDYEEFKKYKRNEEERTARVECLHNSMYG